MPSGHAPAPSDDGPKVSRWVARPSRSIRSRVMQPPVVSTTYRNSSFASNLISFVNLNPSATMCTPLRSYRARYPSARSVRSASIQFVFRVETVIQMRSRESRRTKFTLPIGSPSIVVGENRRAAIARHDLEPVGPEIRDQEVAVAGKRQSIGERPSQVARRLSRRRREMIRRVLGDDRLVAVGRDANDAAPGVGRPERAVRLGEDALGPLQIAADVANGGLVDAEIENRVSCRHGNR